MRVYAGLGAFSLLVAGCGQVETAESETPVEFRPIAEKAREIGMPLNTEDMEAFATVPEGGVNGAPVLSELIVLVNAAVEQGELPQAIGDWSSLSSYDAFLSREDVAPLIDDLLAADGFFFDRDYSLGGNLRFREYGPIHRLANSFIAKGGLSAQEGSADEALLWFERAAWLDEKALYEPLSFAAMARQILRMDLAEQAQRAALSLPPEDAVSLLTALADRLDAGVDWSYAYMGEPMIARYYEWPQFETLSFVSEFEGLVEGLDFPEGRSRDFYQTAIFFYSVELHREMVLAIRQSYPAASERMANLHAKHKRLSETEQYWVALTAGTVIDSQGFLTTLAQVESVPDTLLIAAELHRSRAGKGALPETLPAPVSEITDSEIAYERSGNGYRLWIDPWGDGLQRPLIAETNGFASNDLLVQTDQSQEPEARA
jgi:hypothetical protein